MFVKINSMFVESSVQRLLRHPVYSYSFRFKTQCTFLVKPDFIDRIPQRVVCRAYHVDCQPTISCSRGNQLIVRHSCKRSPADEVPP